MNLIDRRPSGYPRFSSKKICVRSQKRTIIGGLEYIFQKFMMFLWNFYYLQCSSKLEIEFGAFELILKWFDSNITVRPHFTT